MLRATNNKNMKTTQIVQRINEIAGLTKTADMKSAMEALATELASMPEPTSKGKLEHRVCIGEAKQDPNCKYPRQMIEVHKILTELGKPVITLAEVRAAMGENVARLVTKQDPYRIFAFYQKRMEDEGWLTREKERVVA
jgi:hypothetical protein